MPRRRWPLEAQQVHFPCERKGTCSREDQLGLAQAAKEGDGSGGELTGICAQIRSDSQGWGACLPVTAPRLEKADAKETLLISPAWKPVMSSEQNSKRAHLLVSPKLERAEIQERCLGTNLLACLQHKRKSEPWRKVGALCPRAEKAGEGHKELKGDTAYGTGERFVSFNHANVHKALQSIVSYAFSAEKVYVCPQMGC